MYIVLNGVYQASKENKVVYLLSSGNFLGDEALEKKESLYTISCKEGGSLIELRIHDFFKNSSLKNLIL
jgi:hypothetical protein